MKSLYEQLGSPDYLFDSHCHLNDSDYDTVRDDLVVEAKNQGVELIYDIGITLESSLRAIENARKYPTVKAFIGIDPEVCIPGSHFYENDIELKLSNYYEELDSLVASSQQLVAGIGETGLDHYWTKELDAETREESHKNQEELYRMHLELALKHELPLTIHSRGAEARCLEILKEYKVVGIFHSYTGDYETAKKILQAGCGLGINGIVTFKNAAELREIYIELIENYLPRERVGEGVTPDQLYKAGFYFETDSPFLSPEGKRGERNVPANTKLVYEQFLKLVDSSQ